MEFSARQIADMLGGQVEGDQTVTVSQLAKIEEGAPGTLTFLANPKYEEHIYTTGASLAIVNKDFAPSESLPSTLTLIRVEDAYKAFATLLEAYDSYKRQRSGVHPQAQIDESAQLATGVYVEAGAYVGPMAIIGEGTQLMSGTYVGQGVRIGASCVLHPGAKVLENCIVGSSCTLHAGAVVGSDGFGFAPDAANNYKKVPQIGNVVIEDHVEIGANTTVDRATLGSTILRKGVKLDNLIQIAHNVEIGENTVIAAQTGIAGSTKIGKNCMIGGQVGIVGHIQIADGVKIAAQSGISGSIKTEDAIVQGSPALDIRSFKMSYIGFKNLPKLDDRIRALEKRAKDADKSPNTNE